MKKIPDRITHTAVRLLLALAATILVTARTEAQTSANLISNPGFEQSLTPWVYDAANYGGAGDAAVRDPQNPRSGQYSLSAGAGHVAYRSLGVRADTSVELRFWARGDTEGVPVTILLRQSSPGDRVLLRMEMIFTEEWREYVFRTSLPADLAAGAQVYLGFWLHAPGRYWIDDVSLAELPAAEGGGMPSLNPIRNQSFEAGADGWTASIRTPEFGTGWSTGETGNGYPSQPGAKLESIEAADAPHGKRHLSVEVKAGNWGWLTSAYFPARYGHPAALTFWARCSTARSLTAGVAGGKNSDILLQSQPLVLSTIWQKYTVPLTLKPAADGVYVVRIQLGSGRFDFDDFAFVETAQTSPVANPPAHAIQPGSGAPAGNLYAPGDTAAFKLVAAGEQPSSTLAFQVAAVDFLGRKIDEQNVSVAIGADGLGESAFTMQTTTLGAFRIEARRAGAETVLAEQLYSVLPELDAPGSRPDSFFGAHIDLTPYNLEIARRGGFRWLRLYPPMTTKWMAVEPAQGQWRFNTTELAAAKSAGFSILGSFDTAPDWAADINTAPGAVANRWSNSYPPADINQWKTYVTRAFTEFSPHVDAWELWNEPDGGYLQVKPGQQKDAVIRTLLDATHEALAATGRPFTLVGPAVSEINAQLGWQVLDAGAGAKLDAFSFHFYSTAAAGAIPGSAQALELLARYQTHTNRFGQSLPLWHTEGGPWLSGGQSWLATSRMPASSSMTPPQAAAAIVRTALFFKANGVLRHFLYVVAASETGRDIQADGTSACVDVTGIPGPGLAAHAAMVSLTEDAAPAANGFETKTVGESILSVLHFTKASGDVDVYWSTKPVALTDVTALRAGDVVRDMMSNTVPATTAMIGEFPLYILRASDNAVNLPATTTVIEGDTITFNAPAAGEPAPTIHWEYHDGAEWRAIDSSAPFAHQITNGGATLTLPGVTPDLARLQFRYVATIGTLPPVPGNVAAIIVSRLYQPGVRALAVDATGAIYIANTAQNTIDLIDPAGLATVLAGDPGGAAGWLDATGTAARFRQPGGLAIRSGTAYVADTGNNVIRAVEISTGKVTTLAGNASAPAADAAADGAGAAARLKSPAGLAIDDSGHLFVADSKSHTVRAITPDGAVTTIAGWRDEPGADAGHLDTPLDITWGGDGALYVADTGNNAIRKITPGAQPGSGFAMTVLSAAGYASPSGVAWLDGVVHVADTGNSVIRSVPVDGAMRTLAGAVGISGTADGPTGASTRFSAPRDIVAGPDGALYVADTGNKTVRIITDAAIGSTETPLLLTTVAPSGTNTGTTSPPGDNNDGNNGGGGGAASPWFLAALATLALLAKQTRGRSGK
ncbi:hypothetical protein OH491_06905 [Termitidicoccus mucosus]|uniref:Ig-like domain-containing protein n=1 Tax=Termitidicoccus mucosus TaxID=1184151 RepID=A0A178IDX7_9BACT|nr:hypothetical protein AW736_18190 [Opitutaceae bacterium TSB47]